MGRSAGRRNRSGRRQGSRVLLVLAVAAALCAPVVGSSPAAADAPTWSVSKNYQPLMSSVLDLSCPTSDVCFGVGSNPIAGTEYPVQGPRVYATADGGASWQSQVVPETVADLTAISCASATTCVAVGADVDGDPIIVRTVDGGTAWGYQVFPTSALTTLNDVSCPTTLMCEAVGDTAVIGTIDGATWGTQDFGSVSGGADAVDCPSAEICIATSDDIYSTTNANAAGGGADWFATTTPDQFAGSDIACPSVSRCYASGASGGNTGLVVSTSNANAANGAATWTAGPAMGTTVYDVSCTSASVCIAVGYENTGPPDDEAVPFVMGTTDGTTWSALLIPDRLYADFAVPRSIDCPAAGRCLIGGEGSAGAFVLSTTNGGTTWTTKGVDGLPGGPYNLDNAVACPTETSCAVTGYSSFSTSGGQANVAISTDTSAAAPNWTVAPLSGVAEELRGISCPAADTCTAVGHNAGVPVILRTKAMTAASGAGWNPQTVPATVLDLSGIACSSPSNCVAVGSTSSGAAVLATTNGGTTWRLLNVPSGLADLKAVSCPSSASCVAVGTANSGLGVIIGSTNVTAPNSGAVWTTHTTAAWTNQLTSVSCANPTRCVAAGSGHPGSGGVLYTTNASSAAPTWTSGTLPASTPANAFSVYGVACPTTSLCRAVGTSTTGPGPGNETSTAFTMSSNDGGATWVEDTLAPDVQSLTAISCASSTSCHAIGTSTTQALVIVRLGAGSGSAPGAPTISSAAPSTGQVSLSWSAPASSGSSAITGYVVTPYVGGVPSTPITFASTATGQTITGLTDGTMYTFTVRAINAIGIGLPSSGFGPVTAGTTPDAPTGVAATPGNTTATVTWSAPASTGGSPITGYTATASPGGNTCTWTTGPLTCTVTGLSNGTAYTVTVRAANIAGQGPPSSPSAPVTPRTTPGAPTAVTATPGGGGVIVAWDAPASAGGAAIVAYTVTSSPGGNTCTVYSGPLTCAVTGLTIGTLYTFTVRATNAAGQGPASAPSPSAAPLTVPGPPTGVGASAGNASAAVTWLAPVSAGGATITAYTVTASPGGNTCTWSAGPLTCTVTGLANGTPYTFTAKATNIAGQGPASNASLAKIPHRFSDVASSNAFFVDIEWMATQGISTGNVDGTFKPGDAVTRESMAAFLYRFKGSPNGSNPTCAFAPFTDVPKTSPFCGQIAWMKTAGITTGNTDGSFGPTQSVSREAMAAFLYRVKGNPNGVNPTCSVAPFTDVAKSSPFCGHIAWMKASGITTGNPDGSYGPSQSVKREVMAAFLHRLSLLP